VVKQYRSAGRRRFSYAVTAVIFGYCTGTCDSKHSKRANTIFRVGRGQQPRPFLSTSQRSMAENLAHFYRDQRSMADATAKALPSSYLCYLVLMLK
jgi:hypothetical protein